MLLLLFFYFVFMHHHDRIERQQDQHVIIIRPIESKQQGMSINVDMFFFSLNVIVMVHWLDNRKCANHHQSGAIESLKVNSIAYSFCAHFFDSSIFCSRTLRDFYSLVLSRWPWYADFSLCKHSSGLFFFFIVADGKIYLKKKKCVLCPAGRHVFRIVKSLTDYPLVDASLCMPTRSLINIRWPFSLFHVGTLYINKRYKKGGGEGKVNAPENRFIISMIDMSMVRTQPMNRDLTTWRIHYRFWNLFSRELHGHTADDAVCYSHARYFDSDKCS